MTNHIRLSAVPTDTGRCDVSEVKTWISVGTGSSRWVTKIAWVPAGGPLMVRQPRVKLREAPVVPSGLISTRKWPPNSL